MNHVVLVGRVVRDPDLKFIPGNGTATCTITLAVDKFVKGEKQADFVPVVIWGKQAESTANYMVKGSQMAISGRIQTRNYEAKDGTRRYVTEVVANEVQFLSKGKDGANNFGNMNQDAFSVGNFNEDIIPVNDGDMPF